jgi:hypothetical protein
VAFSGNDFTDQWLGSRVISEVDPLHGTTSRGFLIGSSAVRSS